MATTVIQKSVPYKSHPASPKPHAVMKSKFRFDPKRPLEPARKKLSTIETQRVMSVVEDGIRKVQFVSILPSILENIERHKVSLGTEIQLLEKHIIILDSYSQLKLKSLEAVKTNSKRVSSAENVKRNLGHVEKQVEFSLKNIMRSFFLNQNLMNGLLQEYTQYCSTESQSFIHEMENLKDILMGMLLTTPVEESEKMQYMKEITEREKHNSAIVEQLEAELDAATAKMDQEISEKNDIIREIQTDMHQVDKTSDERITRIRNESQQQIDTDTSKCENAVQKLQYDVSQLKMQLQNMVSEHRESELNLRKKKYKIETEVENWIQKYDQDMGERHAEYEEIDSIYTEEKKQLNELEEKFKTLEEEYIKIMEERKLERERKEATDRELEIATTAATCIQAFWRSYKVRKAIKANKKKKSTKKSSK